MSVLKIVSNEMGLTNELMDKMRKILKIFDPIIFPTARSLFFFMAATTEVASSGNDVPMATMVKLITFSLTPSELAI